MGRRTLPALLLAGAFLAALAIPFARGADLCRVLAVLSGSLAVAAGAAAVGAAAIGAAMGAAIDRRLGDLERWLSPRRAAILLAAAILAYTAFWTAFSILRHEGLNSSGFDLAIQHQVVWNLAHGRGYESSIEVSNYLGDHVALTLPLFAPLLWIHDDVRMLLFGQSLALALAAWPVYRIARRRGIRRIEALLWGAVYLLTPAVGFMNKYDFHDLVLAVPFLLFAIDGLEGGRLARASLFLLLAAATREEVGLAVAALGVWVAIARRRRAFGLGWAAGALVWAVVALYVVIPHFRGGASSDTLARYGWLGGEPGEILRTLVTRPWTLFATHYHRVRRAVFPLQLLWPYAGLPLFAIGRLLPALPNLGLSLASSAISQNSIYFQYNAPILPFFLWAGIAGSQKIAARGASSRGWAAAALLFGVLTANVADPAAWKDVPRPYTIVDGIRPRPNREAFAALASAIPAGADLLASNDLAPHFSERRSLHVFHTQRPNPQAEWAILDLTDRRHIQSAEEMARELQRMVREEGYGVLACRKGIVVLRRGQPSDPDALAGLRDALRADGLPAP